MLKGMTWVIEVMTWSNMMIVEGMKGDEGVNNGKRTGSQLWMVEGMRGSQLWMVEGMRGSYLWMVEGMTRSYL
jgi:hypothetical protein